MRAFAIALVLTLTSTVFTFAQTVATTSDGKKVLLKEDGTWTYVSPPQTAVTDFRNAIWGMSVARVKEVEATKPVKEQNDLLVFKGTISSLETYIGYFFTNGILARARYAISEEHLNNDDYITDFTLLKAQLTKKYGAPGQDETHWKDDSHKHTSGLLGLAISGGNLSYYTSWTTPRTRIVLALYAESYQIRLTVEYTSVDYGPLEEAQDLKDF